MGGNLLSGIWSGGFPFGIPLGGGVGRTQGVPPQRGVIGGWVPAPFFKKAGNRGKALGGSKETVRCGRTQFPGGPLIFGPGGGLRKGFCREKFLPPLIIEREDPGVGNQKRPLWGGPHTFVVFGPKKGPHVGGNQHPRGGGEKTGGKKLFLKGGESHSPRRRDLPRERNSPAGNSLGGKWVFTPHEKMALGGHTKKKEGGGRFPPQHYMGGEENLL